MALAGKSIVITGAGRGLGQAYARDAARCGASVVVNDLDPTAAADTVALIEAEGGRAIANSDAVGGESAAKAIMDAAADAFGRLDGVVNNAGIYYHTDPWDETAGQVERLVAVNLVGTILCGIAAMRAMRQQGIAGSIVNITSGTHLGTSSMGTYVATKGGIVALTRSWALDLRDRGIRVNAISPVAQTPLMAMAPGAPQHFPTPETVAPLSSWLLSDRSTHFTGHVVRLTGSELRVLDVAEHVDPPVSRREWTFEAIDAIFNDSTCAQWVPPLRAWRG